MLFLIWADEKYNTPKNPSVVFATQKNPGVFHRPKKIPFGQNVRPQNILRIPPSLKYVSGAPGGSFLPFYFRLRAFSTISEPGCFAVLRKESLHIDQRYWFSTLGMRFITWFVVTVQLQINKFHARTFQGFFKENLHFSRTKIYLINQHSLTPFDHPIS